MVYQSSYPSVHAPLDVHSISLFLVTYGPQNQYIMTAKSQGNIGPVS